MQLADLQDYTPSVQHDLARTFTLIMSMGIVASVIVGWLIDEIGLEICTAMTLVMGQLQMLLIIFFGGNQTMLEASFVVYTVFRQFLYPVFIASLTSHLGFKYFGVLLGIGFAVGGFAQLSLSAVVAAAQGDCHALETLPDGSECNHGHWAILHGVQFVILGVLLFVPLQDYREKRIRETKIHKILSEPAVLSCSYGTDL